MKICNVLLLFLFITSIKQSIHSQQDMGLNNEKIIGKPELKLNGDLMTPEALWSFGRISDVQVSPDNSIILYVVKYYDIESNKGNGDVYTMSVKGENLKQITQTIKSEIQPMWRPDGKRIGFIYPDENSEMQLFEMNPDGSGRKQISYIFGGITGYRYSTDSKKVIYIREVNLVKQVTDFYPDLKKANARIIDDLMFRHWDSWTDSYSHIFIADFDGNKLSNDKDIMKDEEFDSPVKPLAGIEQIVWSPDSKSIAYTCVKKKGKEYTVSTNSEIYIYNLDNQKTINLTEGMAGYDRNPVYSPDGKKIAWESMEHDAYESDKVRLMVHDFSNNSTTDYSKDFDQNAEDLCWSADSKSIYFKSDYHALFQIYRLDPEKKKIQPVTKGVHNYLSVAPAGNLLIGSKHSMSMPTEIFSIDPLTGTEKQLSFVNKDLLAKLTMGKVEERWVKTTDNKQMLVWVIYPPHFDPAKKYPALLYCQGGPQSSVSQFFSYRWNFQIMAANNYIIVAPNRRGLPSFGKEWNEQISGDYGGQNMKDYLTAIDEVAKEPYVNKDKLGAVGASYGAFSVYWLAGNHNKRFKAFIAHDGMFNLESQYLETEEMWFVNWDLGGPFWDASNKIAQKSYATSPHKFVQNWDAPILIIHGGLDYRISYTQGMQAFTAARLLDVPARFLYFPEENHWVLKPQNGILWQRIFFDWLDKYLK